MQTLRLFAHLTYYLSAGRELEEQFLSSAVHVISKDGEFAQGKEVSFNIGGKTKTMHMRWPIRWFRVQRISYLIILVFAAMNIALLIWNR